MPSSHPPAGPQPPAVPDPPHNPWGQASLAMTIPMMMAAGPLLGFLLGLAVDRWLDPPPPWNMRIKVEQLGTVLVPGKTAKQALQEFHESPGAFTGNALWDKIELDVPEHMKHAVVLTVYDRDVPEWDPLACRSCRRDPRIPAELNADYKAQMIKRYPIDNILPYMLSKACDIQFEDVLSGHKYGNEALSDDSADE